MCGNVRQCGQGRVNGGEKDTADGEGQVGGGPTGSVDHGEMDFLWMGLGSLSRLFIKHRKRYTT